MNNKWSTKIRLPLLDKVNAERFMGMAYKVATLFGVSKKAYWYSIPLGDNYYELWAEYEVEAFTPIKKKQIRLLSQPQQSH